MFVGLRLGGRGLGWVLGAAASLMRLQDTALGL